MSEIYDNGKMTIKEFDDINVVEGIVYELIDGIMYMSKPNIQHQRISGKLFRKISEYLDNNKCEPIQEIEIKLKNDILVPDISILCDSSLFTENRYNGAPTIAIEILSPSTSHMDLFTKLYKYEMFRVQEYWIVSPKGKTITVHNFDKKIVTVYDESETLKSEVFQDLEIKLIDIF